MKSFRTELVIRRSTVNIEPNTGVVSMGSCFAQSIGAELRLNKFKVLSNPLGTLYDPLSIHQAINCIATNTAPADDTYVEGQGLWHSFDVHSSLSRPTRDEAVIAVERAIDNAHGVLNNAECIIITYGTARIFERVDTGTRVANCHKLPSRLFHTRLLSPEEIINSFGDLMSRFPAGKHIIITVSPVRHLRESFEMNSTSKAILRYACAEIANLHGNAIYFPSFEIMMDDLRDYRFYEKDMIHPSREALEYIWERFAETFFSPQTRDLLSRWKSISTALNHRPFNAASDAHQQFLNDVLKKLEELKPELAVEEEIRAVKAQIAAP